MWREKGVPPMVREYVCDLAAIPEDSVWQDPTHKGIIERTIRESMQVHGASPQVREYQQDPGWMEKALKEGKEMDEKENLKKRKNDDSQDSDIAFLKASPKL